MSFLPPASAAAALGPAADGEAASTESRQTLIARLDLRGHLGDPQLDAIVETLVAGCGVPVAVVNIVTPDLQTYAAEVGVGAPCTSVPDHLSFCAEVVRTGRRLRVPDSQEHPVYADNPLVSAGSVRSYAGEPLFYGGHVIGSVSIFDVAPREFTPAELRVLAAQARLASAAIALRASAGWDRLTGLALRPLLLDWTTHALDELRRQGGMAGQVALLVLDVDHMTAVNEALGSDRGDEVLRWVANRLRAACGPDDNPARIGGDEFAVLFHAVTSRADARRRSDAVLAAVTGPAETGAVPVALRSGLAITPSAGADALLAAAERALARRGDSRPVRMLDAAVESPMCAVSDDGTIREVNRPWRAFAAANGGGAGACGVGANYLTVCDQATGPDSAGAAAVARGLRRVLSGSAPRFEYDYPCHARGQQRWFSLRATRTAHGSGAVLSHHDITGTKLAERAISRQALREAPGELPDRGVLADHVAHALAEGARSHHLVAVGVLALDDPEPNAAGAPAPPSGGVLAEVGRRLGLRIRAGDTLALTKEGQFVVVWRDLDSTEQAQHLAAHLRMDFDLPFAVAGEVLLLTASIGVSIQESALSGEELLAGAHAAMRDARSRGSGQLRIFRPAELLAATAKIRTETHLLQALQRDELVLHYQPVVDLVTGAVVGVEALVRWQHPTDGLLGPDLFIPLAEATGLIVALGAWVLEEACAQAVAWHAQDLPIQIAVNLSTVQIADPALVSTVARILLRTGMDAHQLVFEVTESAVMEDAESAVVVLNALAASGISFAIDDFGTGYSSLVYLKRYPLRALKIDRSFVSGMGVNEEDDAIVASVIGLARAVGGSCIAEGIETHEQFAALRALGCGFGQGWLFGKGVPGEELPALVQSCQQDLAVRLVGMPPPGDQRDLAGERRDRAAEERDQLADERDRIGDERDQFGDGRDKVADQRDEAGDQRDVAADARDQRGLRRDVAADARDHVSEQRDEVGVRRDQAGERRDEAADRRNQQAGQRDQAAEQRDHAADARDQAAERSESTLPADVPSLSSAARQAAASDRNRASQDRRAGANERNLAEQDRTTAVADRAAGAAERTHAEQDRATALDDRGAGADERGDAETDRGTAQADRGAGARGRVQAERDRQTALADRVSGASNRERAEQDRGTALSDRGAAAEDRDNSETGDAK